MAYTTPRTWVTGELVTAALLNTHLRDNLSAAFPLGVDAWTTYTPTLTQSATVTKTGTYAKYQRAGRWITVQVFLTVTGAGTAANAVLVGLPVTAAFGSSPLEVGTGTVFDSSANLAYKGNAIMASTSTVQFRASGTSTSVLGVTDFAAALASGDTVAMTVTYEAAT